MTLQKLDADGSPIGLDSAVAECLGEPAPLLVRQPGGLSTRRFFRMRRATGEPAMVMWLPEDAPERQLALKLGRPLPFLELRALLEERGVRVPRLFGALPDLGLLVVEDLGETLAERCEREPAAQARLYQRAVIELARAQRALEVLPEGSIVTTRGFGRELLTAEVDHFRQWGVEALGVDLTPGESARYDAASRYVVDEILRLPRGFTHRDYQSRNLMALPDDAIGWIDFQDALLGPRAYDLAALLRDSYQSFDEAFVARLLNEYADASGLPATEVPSLRRELDLITVQRKLKDAGRFVFFERTRGDSSYLRYFVPTLEMVRGALSRLAGPAELSGLDAIVTRQIEIGRSRGMLKQ